MNVFSQNVQHNATRKQKVWNSFILPWFYSPLIATNEGSPQKPDSNTMPFHVERGVNQVTMGHFFLEYFDPRVNIIPPQLYIHIAIYYRTRSAVAVYP
jgi:hypothetical protein